MPETLIAAIRERISVYEEWGVRVGTIWLPVEDARLLRASPSFDRETRAPLGEQNQLVGYLFGARVFASTLVPARHVAMVQDDIDGVLMGSAACMPLERPLQPAEPDTDPYDTVGDLRRALEVIQGLATTSDMVQQIAGNALAGLPLDYQLDDTCVRCGGGLFHYADGGVNMSAYAHLPSCPHGERRDPVEPDLAIPSDQVSRLMWSLLVGEDGAVAQTSTPDYCPTVWSRILDD